MKLFRHLITERAIKPLFIVVFALTLAIQLFVPPTIGLADNGDFQKIAAYFDLFPILTNPSQDNGKFEFFSPKYTRDIHQVLMPPVATEDWTKFVDSIPYQFQYARRSDEDFIAALYLSAFHRPPDEAGKRFWLDVLAQHKADRADVFHRFIESPEWKLGGAYAKGERLISSTPILVAPGIYASRMLSKGGLADVRLIGFVYAAVLIAALAWVLPVLRGFSLTSWVLLLATVWLVFADVSYAAQLNSFFIDTAAYVGLFVAIAGLLRMAAAGEDIWAWAAVLLGLCFFTTSKLQHVPAGLCFATLLLAYALRTGTRYKLVVLLGYAAMLFGTGEILRYTSPEYRANPIHNNVFLNIVPNAPDPADALRQLRLPAEYVIYSGMMAYDEHSPLQRPQYRAEIAGVSQLRILRFYLTHPAVMIRVLERDLGDTDLYRNTWMGNFEQSAGRPPRALSQSFAYWSRLKVRLFTGHPWRFVVYWLVLVLITLLALMRTRANGLMRITFAAITLVAIVELGIGAFGDGLENGRHLGTFAALSDFAFIAAVAGATAYAEMALSGFRRQRHSTHSMRAA